MPEDNACKDTPGLFILLLKIHHWQTSSLSLTITSSTTPHPPAPPKSLLDFCLINGIWVFKLTYFGITCTM